MNKNSNAYATWGNKPGSYLSTLNPFSGLIGTTDRVPEWWMNAMPGDLAGEDKKHLAHLTFKTGACALLAAALVGGYRVAKHFQTATQLEAKDSTARKVTSGLDNSFATSMGKNLTKNSAEEDDGKWIKRPTVASFSNIAGTVAPLGASLLVASLAYSMADDWADNRRNRLLDEAIARKSEAVKQLIQTRGRVARGSATPAEINQVNALVNRENTYVKNASLTKDAGLWDSLKDIPRKSFQGYGLLASALLVASAIGGYEYFKATDEDNIRFKATEKGLNEYAKNKANMSTVNIVPTDAGAYFDRIDQGAPKATDRTAIEIDTNEMNKPISISL